MPPLNHPFRHRLFLKPRTLEIMGVSNFPSPRPSPLQQGRGRVGATLSTDRAGLNFLSGTPCGSPSRTEGEWVRVRVYVALFHVQFFTTLE